MRRSPPIVSLTGRLSAGKTERLKRHRIEWLADVRLEDPQAVSTAVLWYAEGIDFTDALHLNSSGMVEGFATFDRSLLRKAGRVSTVNLIVP